MTWSVGDIESRLLSTDTDVIAIPTDLFVESVNRVERVLGGAWIEESTRGARGIAPALQIVGLGLHLAALDDVPSTNDLIANLRRRSENAEAELAAIFLIRQKVRPIEVELYPAVGSRKADFRVRRDNGPWVYVEVTSPNQSEEQVRLQRIISGIAVAFKDLPGDFGLEILFKREPTPEEIELLRSRLPEFCALRGQRQASLAANLGYLFLNDSNINSLMPHQLPENPERPMIGLAMLVGGGSGTVSRQVFVQIPFSDERAERFLKREARQLPKDGPGLIMVDVRLAPGGLRGWVPIIANRLQPTIFTRVGGVCLFQTTTAPVDERYGLVNEATFVKNPHANHKLPDWVGATFDL